MNYGVRVRRLPPALLLPAVILGLSSGPIGGHAWASPTDPPSAARRPAVSATPATTARAAETRQITDAAWDGGSQWRTGRKNGVRVRKGALVLAKPTRSRRTGGTTYDVGQWTSPWTSPGFSLTELIASWQAATPRNSWIEVRVRGRVNGVRSSWDILGRWAETTRWFRRTSVSGQGDDLADVAVDTWRVPGAGAATYQVQVRLMRRAGKNTASPSVDSLHAVATRLPSGTPATSKPGKAAKAGGITLAVPKYSQMIHTGHSPQYGGGGEAWCSPTSTAMVLGYYDSLPTPASYAWVGSGHTDPWVDAAALGTYDRDYEGAGNWPFNTAYAATLTDDAFVTRLASLRAAERYLAARIPLVVSISFGRGDLDGAPISSTAGHLLVIVGFTAGGDVVVNDPASSNRRGVRRTYDRAQFEAAWLDGSGGLTYVIHDDAHPLP